MRLSFLASNANTSLKKKNILAYFIIINIQFVVLILISSISIPSQSTLFTGLFNLLIVLELPTPPLFPKLVDSINGLSFNNLEISVLFPTLISFEFHQLEDASKMWKTSYELYVRVLIKTTTLQKCRWVKDIFWRHRVCQ